MQVNSAGQERQHFLLSSAAVDVSEVTIARLTPEQAYAEFEAIRFFENDGIPFCPHCKTSGAYRLTISRRTKAGAVVPTPLYKCRNYKGVDGKKPCAKQFSVTSGTIFASRKMPIGDILCAIMTFVNASSGEAALRLRRAIGCSYKTAFVLEGKLREAILLSRDARLLKGVIEVDGTEVGGHARKAVMKENGRVKHVGGKSQQNSLVFLRERSPTGESRCEAFDNEARYRDPATGKDFIRDNVLYGETLVSDEGFELGYIGPHRKVKHKEGYKINGVHNNGAEGIIGRLKRAENGVHYGWSGKKDYLRLYGAETCWREDYRRKSNGELWEMLVKAGTHAPVSRLWAKYWQRWQVDDPTVRRRHLLKAA